MEKLTTAVLWVAVALQAACASDVQHSSDEHAEDGMQGMLDTIRGRRGVIEEEKFYNINPGPSRESVNQRTPWLPGGMHSDEDPTTNISIANDVSGAPELHQTTEGVTDKPTGRGARASNENWVKLPYPTHIDPARDHLTPPQPTGDLISSRMPRVNFVTQNKALDTSETRNDKESIQRSTRTDELRTEVTDEFARQRPLYPRQAVYYPEAPRRPYYEERYYPDDMYSRDPYYEFYDRKRYSGPRVDRYDDPYDSYMSRKPKRIIYYAHLPEVVRTPPSVDLRYRYSADPYRRFDDDYSRTGRYDYRFRNRYPYAALRKDERNYRDLASAGTATKDKKLDEKVTPTPVLPKKTEKNPNSDANRSPNKNTINSHQYHESDASYSDQMTHKGFMDSKRPDNSYYRFEEPLFHAAIEDPYQRTY
ncbi:unnamed protein product, partial [Iphiclides podalirius]